MDLIFYGWPGSTRISVFEVRQNRWAASQKPVPPETQQLYKRILDLEKSLARQVITQGEFITMLARALTDYVPRT